MRVCTNEDKTGRLEIFSNLFNCFKCNANANSKQVNYWKINSIVYEGYKFYACQRKFITIIFNRTRD